MGNCDIALKHLVERWPEAVLEVIMPGARFVEYLHTERPQAERYTDRVMRVAEEADGRELLVHVGLHLAWGVHARARETERGCGQSSGPRDTKARPLTQWRASPWPT